MNKVALAIFGYEYISLFKKRSNKKRKFCHYDIMDLITRVEARKIDVSSLLGDSLKEKYQSIYVKLFELSNELGKSGNYPDVIVADQWTSNLFECSASSCCYYDHKEEVVRVKSINGRWELYRDLSLPVNTILLTGKDLMSGIVIETNFN